MANGECAEENKRWPWEWLWVAIFYGVLTSIVRALRSCPRVATEYRHSHAIRSNIGHSEDIVESSYNSFMAI